ncbi:MAG: hypothetical protein LBW85_03500 [Deltaproteobacteria bacterium]|jgi:hypothetical protein|nr:hypothetical protein [Deltaproteobacteria bacterium]
MDDQLYFYIKDCEINQKEFKFYLNILKDTLYPFLIEIETKIENYSCDRADYLYSSFDPDQQDPSDIEIATNEDTLDFSLSLINGNAYILLLTIAGIYHLWEKSVIDFLTTEIRHCRPSFPPPRSFNQISKYFNDYNINLSNYNFFNDLNELRLITNTVKHGEGESIKQLIDINSSILVYKPENRNIFYRFYNSDYKLYPRKEHIERYGDAIIQFWDYNNWDQARGHFYRKES